MSANKNNQMVDPTASNLAKHFAWKERVRKEQNSVYTSLEKCVSMGILSKLPLKEEEIMGLQTSATIDPYQVLAKLKENQNDSVANYYPHSSNVNNESNAKDEEESNKIPIKVGQRRYSAEDGEIKTIVLPRINSRLSSNETVPYSEYVIGNKSSVKKEVPLFFDKTSREIYKPQKKQYFGEEKKTYMVGTINLRQPKFTYFSLEKQESQKINFKPEMPVASELFYSPKYGTFLRKEWKKDKESKSPLKVRSGSVPLLKPTPSQTPKVITSKFEGLNVHTSDGVNMRSSINFPVNEPKALLSTKSQKNNLRTSKNGLYKTQTVNGVLDLKEKQRLAKEIIKARKLKQEL